MYLQRVTGEGRVSEGWLESGIAVCTVPSSQVALSMAPDDAGGVVIAWIDGRSLMFHDIYAIRVTAEGKVAPGWIPDGTPICTAAMNQLQVVLAPDGAGGAFITWQDERFGTSNQAIYAQHILGTGAIAPGWPTDGMPVSPVGGPKDSPAIVSDGLGGAIVGWTEGDIYCQRIMDPGVLAPGWPAFGLPLCIAPGIQGPVRLASDGANGAIACWADARFGMDFRDGDLYAQRATSDGAIAAGWPENGARITAETRFQPVFRMIADGEGGILVSFDDYRNPAGGIDVYAMRLTGEGNPAFGWPQGGTPVSSLSSWEYETRLSSDGAGGAYIVWLDFRLGDYDLYAQHLRGDGTIAAGWPSNGLPLCTNPHLQQDPEMTTDGKGGVLVAWEDARNDTRDIYAQRIVLDGPVPTLVSFMEASAEPGLVKLRWFAPDAAQVRATVDRRSMTSHWEELGTPSVVGTDYLVYEDESAPPGRVGYRLRYFEGSEERFTEESWLDVPNSVRLSLAGFRPSPSMDGANVAFSLPEAGRATLEVHDVRGRVVFAREVGSLGPGSHVLRIDGEQRLSTGVYLIRLVHPEGTLTSKGIVAR
ncbi:MAG: T9SS type A sorting domain-containing protein [Candidatus Methylomirabilaceae bacterium]